MLADGSSLKFGGDVQGWRGRDHWHYQPGGKGGDHLRPGDEIPDGSSKGSPESGPAECCGVDDPDGVPPCLASRYVPDFVPMASQQGSKP